MAERAEEPEAEGASEAGVGPISPAAAMAIGARRQRAGPRPDPKLDHFLDQQSRLTELQTEHLHEQRELMLSRLRLGRWKDRVTLALQLMTAVVGLAIAMAVGAMAWQAHEDHGLSIAPFSVPPDLVARGLTGQVVAARVLDRLSQLQAETVSARPASSYANDWGDEIKVEIPETGVSIGELNRYLRAWLGSETRVTGEVVRIGADLQVLARAGEATARPAQGPEADLDGLIAQAAEAVFAQTQPYRFAVYLASHGRQGEATAQFARLARSGPPEDRPWAYAGWASILQAQGHHYDAIRMARAAITLNPNMQPAYEVLGVSSDVVGRWSIGIDNPAKELALVRSGRALGVPASRREEQTRFLEAVEAYYHADNLTAVKLLDALVSFDLEGRQGGYAPLHLRAQGLAKLHEVTAAERMEAGPLDTNSYQAIAIGAATLEDWSEVAGRLERGRSAPGLAGDAQETVVRPLLAQAYAHIGRLDEAKAMVATTPLDCYRCLTTRAEIAALERDWAAADRWWAELDRQNPTRPLAQAGEARSLLDRGLVDRAIAVAREGYRRSPHFADPLEIWGEALLKKGDLAGAAGKFAEAAANAPHWGRDHLMWGEALLLEGRYADARARFEAGGGMDLSKADRAALGVLLARTASGPLHG